MASGNLDPVNPITVPGSILAGKFRVERVLGQGGMGVVVAATHLQLEQLVAIKFLLPEACAVPNAIARFMQEARAAAKIRSEHIGRVMDVSTLDDGTPYIVMEYLEGQDLAALLAKRGQLPIAEAVTYLLQACDAVSEAHALGIVHRDLKPANLFLTHRGDGSPLVKVLDFGISKSLTDTSQSSNLTGTAFIMGSPQYMSPEQVRSAKHVDTRTDIWSLGVIAHELLAGSPPFTADTATALLIQIAVDEPCPLRSVRPEIEPEFEQVLARCLAKDPNARFQTVKELAQALAPYGLPGASASHGGPRTVVRSVSAQPDARAVSTEANWSNTREQGSSGVTRPIIWGGVVLVLGVAVIGAWRWKAQFTEVAAQASGTGSTPSATNSAALTESTPRPSATLVVASPKQPDTLETEPSPSVLSSAASASVAPTPHRVPPRPVGIVSHPPVKPRSSSATQVGGSIDPLEGRR